jgi:predicted metal-dependent HD superfamily phosphohydrolase
MWDTIGLNSKKRDSYYNDYIKVYTDPSRHYHNLDHISEGLEEIEELSVNVGLEKYITALMYFAWWNHDYVYFTINNEKLSSIHAIEVIKQCVTIHDPMAMCNISTILIEDCIEFTTHDKHYIDKRIVQYFLDIDLARLGVDSNSFDIYSNQIRKEYSQVPLKVYNLARIEIMSGFLKRPHIYLSEYFRGKYETQARKNVKRHIEELKEQVK